MIPTKKDFMHGSINECYCCQRQVECLYFRCSTWICCKCFPWWLASERPSEVHNHAAPYVPRLGRFEINRKYPDLRKRL